MAKLKRYVVENGPAESRDGTASTAYVQYSLFFYKDKSAITCEEQNEEKISGKLILATRKTRFPGYSLKYIYKETWTGHLRGMLCINPVSFTSLKSRKEIKFSLRSSNEKWYFLKHFATRCTEGKTFRIQPTFQLHLLTRNGEYNSTK